MYVGVYVGVLVAAAIGVGMFFDIGTYLKTGWLVLRATPYEQAGTGAGSILIVGDSTGYGTGSTDPTKSVAGRLGSLYPGYRIINNSQNGRQTAGALAFVRTVEDRHDLVLLQIGANDLLAGSSAQQVADSVQQVAKEATTRAAAVVVMTAGNIGGSVRFAGEQAEQYRVAAKEYDRRLQAFAAATPNVWFVSLYEEPAADPFVIEPTVYMASDGLHPTAAGYGIWFAKAKPLLAAALNQ